MSTRKLAAAGAAALAMVLAAAAPTDAGLRMNGLRFNGLMFNGLRLNGPDQPVVAPLAGGGGFSFNAVKLYDVVLPDGGAR